MDAFPPEGVNVIISSDTVTVTNQTVDIGTAEEQGGTGSVVVVLMRELGPVVVVLMRELGPMVVVLMRELDPVVVVLMRDLDRW